MRGSKLSNTGSGPKPRRKGRRRTQCLAAQVLGYLVRMTMTKIAVTK